MSTLNQIKDLIFELRGAYKFELTENTLLQKDLGIYGDDAPEFIERLAHMFNVDISEFKYAKYFEGEGGIYNPWLTNLLKIEDDFGKKPLTLGDLVIAVEKGNSNKLSSTLHNFTYTTNTMIRHIFNFITNNVLYVLVGLILGASACQTYWHSNPIVPSVSKDSSAIKVCLPTPFEQNIVGAWHFKMNTRTGTVIFNSDKTVVDSDSLFKFGRSSPLPIKTEVCGLEMLTISPLNTEGKLFTVRGYASDRLGNNTILGALQFRKVKVNECNHILLAAVGNDLLGLANKELDIDLTR